SLTVDGAPQTLGIRFSPAPSAPLSVAIDQVLVSTSCLDGDWVWSFALSAQGSGGTAPYAFNWSLPTGTATGPLVVTSLQEAPPGASSGASLPSGTVRVTAVDAQGQTAVNQTIVVAGTPPTCPSSVSSASGLGGALLWVWTGVFAAVGIAVGAGVTAVVIARRRSR
ncbi:MAG: hypothetical protein AAFA34_02470, partial [Thermoplasmata archaeon]